MTLQRYLRRLRLRPGDILLCRRDGFNQNIALSMAGRAAGIKFNIPFVYYDKKNDICRMPFEELERIYLGARKAHGGFQDISILDT